MLGKVLKYEFKSTTRLFLPTYLATLVFALLERLFGNISFLQNLWGGRIYGLITTIYVLIIIMTICLTFVLIVQRFYKNLLKDEGYLSQTLPVSVDTHIWGKVIPAVAWTVLSTLVVCLSLLLLLGTNENLSEFGRGWNEFRSYFNYAFTMPLWLFITEIVIVVILGAFSGILAFYSALSIGNLANSHKVLASVAAYFVLSMVLGTVYGAIAGVIGSTSWGNWEFETISTGLWTLLMGCLALFILVDGAIHYLISRYILKNRLNLE